MGNSKYVYNEKNLQFEKFKPTWKQTLSKWGLNASLLLIMSLVIVHVSSIYFPTPKEKAQAFEIEQLSYHLDLINKDIKTLAENLENLHQKDNEIHRTIFDMPAMDKNMWEVGRGGSESFSYLKGLGVTGEHIKASLEKIEDLKVKYKLQQTSLDTLYELAIRREERIASIPSIKPVREDKLKRKVNHLSGFGIRLHPVHKVKKLHQGIDFTAPRGTAIQATGNGKIVRVKNGNKGYGNNVIIDHGFGFKTLYAHMQTIDVKKGENVVKGQKIGTVGSTGTSTAPHLHYEVWINGKAVNPIDYVLDGLTPEEYMEVVQKASAENQSWD
jgi:murein DD-endopeptidase MepM/ murein hydrolase activator NlpD